MGEPSGTPTPRRSEGIEEPGESTGNAGNQEPTDIPTTSTDTESLEAKTEEEPAPLNRQTGALVPVESSASLSPLRWLWSYISYNSSGCYSYIYDWFWPQASATHKEDPGRNLCSGAEGNEDDEDPGSGFEQIDHSECGLPLLSQFKASTDCKQVGIKGKSFKENIDKIREIIGSTFSTLSWHFSTYHTVGIFSRSSESDYEWLISQLKSKPFHTTVSTVLPHSISNNGMRQFRGAVSGCTFGILYHTKNRGRINIVDVTDSLYDEELQYMSERLGKENVIVVVDDLEDTGEGEKTRILECQPSIGNLAKDLILFSANDKQSVR